eukprot:3456803-Amphidinium_carterae.3
MAWSNPPLIPAGSGMARTKMRMAAANASAVGSSTAKPAGTAAPNSCPNPRGPVTAGTSCPAGVSVTTIYNRIERDDRQLPAKG